MTCIARDKGGAEVLMDYGAGTLDPVRRAAIDEHIRECGECRHLVEAQRGLWQTLDAWKPIEVSPDFDAKLYARIAQTQAEPWWYRMWKPALSIAAVAAVATVLFVARPEPKIAPAAPSSAQVQRIDIQQVQQALDDLDLLTPASSNAPSPL